jgi:exodeoxyribonuclease VII large subunit
LKAVFFNFAGKHPDDAIGDGASVICTGRVDVYEKRGEYQLIADSIQAKGRGLLQMSFSRDAQGKALQGGALRCRP